jgi:peroxiredoxin
MRYRLTVLSLAMVFGCGSGGGEGEDIFMAEVTEVVAEAEVAEELQEESPSNACEEPEAPPPGWTYSDEPPGTEVGDRFPALEFEDCDGNLVSIPELTADSELTLFSLAAGWCSPCLEESSTLMTDLHQPYCGSGLRIVQVLFQDPAGLPATKFFCKQWRSQYSLTIPVLVDPLFLTEGLLGDSATPLNILTDPTGKILYRQEGYSAPELHSAIESYLP